MTMLNEVGFAYNVHHKASNNEGETLEKNNVIKSLRTLGIRPVKVLGDIKNTNSFQMELMKMLTNML